MGRYYVGWAQTFMSLMKALCLLRGKGMKSCFLIFTFSGAQFAMISFLLATTLVHIGLIYRRIFKNCGYSMDGCPTKSPNINPTQHIWNALGRTVGTGFQLLEKSRIYSTS
ncbi:hypothetical protein AVEN_207546-1 [Araneus ventricosus]|uniref:Uncharacterized protein n=1 Tax=Araneus ventricosus TaxID=182803 RepID=A0A4Y2RJS7_ARAVE|nr:hypothetical protein AVEN_207546-1 [Araneus ventricosus]